MFEGAGKVSLEAGIPGKKMEEVGQRSILEREVKGSFALLWTML